MTELQVIENSGVLLIDSRLIASRIGIEHRSFMDTIRKYQPQAEQAFGILRFETAEISGRGQPERFVYLTEDQATFLMTLSRNTPEVIQCKIELVKKFSEAKRRLSQQGVAILPHTTVYIRRLENMFDHDIDYQYWSVFREGAEVLLLIEKEYKVPVDVLDLCDGSIGSHWSQYRKSCRDSGEQWVKPEGSYTHRFRDQRGERSPRAYDIGELPIFRRWLNEQYIPTHLPQYLVDKYGKRAVRQIYSEINKLSPLVLQLTEEKRPTAKQEELHQIFLAAREALDIRKQIDSQY
jgi:Phage regulatory protein Rha (Phage_pRha)